eukprot:PITA_28874
MDNGQEKPLTQSPSADFHDVCKIEKKECLDNCTMLYRFVSEDLHKFSILHQVFGACNVIKMIEELPTDQRVEAINSMVYEASARLQDPALGCAGIIQRLQLQISDLESQITATQGKIQKVCSQQAQLLASIPGINNKFNPAMSTSVNDADEEKENLFDSKRMD